MVSSSGGGIVIGRPVVQSKKEKEKEAAAKQQGIYPYFGVYIHTHTYPMRPYFQLIAFYIPCTPSLLLFRRGCAFLYVHIPC
jgi:hypothetical protein